MDIKRNLPRLTRWLHIYLSMLSFAVVFFFAITGLTLNHAERFNGQMHVREKKGKVDRNWTNAQDTLKIGKLQIVESLRRENSITAPLRDLRIDDAQIGLSFKGPGYEADVFVDRETGEYELTETSGGLIGIINDLHKGRDTGTAGSVFVDISAILLALVSLTGLLLLLFLRRKRLSGLLVAAFGLILCWLVYVIWIK
ncbi:MAG TPA: PepSY-associated TM helix domain-containing protein [Puia sp.]